jgi:alpha-tubulin suppressor-like RCC1 family protein
VLDVDGTAWLFGRNSPSALGIPNVDAVSENSPKKLQAVDLGAPKGTKFVDAACGRGHSLLVGSDGEVWSAGINNLGQVRVIVNLQRYPSVHQKVSAGMLHVPKFQRSKQ